MPIAPVALLLATLLAGGAAQAQPPHCPPGHAKKGWCAEGAYRLPPGLRTRAWEGWRERGLRRPADGQRWVRVDDEAFLIVEATREVVEAIVAVDRAIR